ncbi:MAG: hypothetical protein QNJ46_03900 [Leptolyngbyaceae cyanobacterium MO_188.B28]|nr:hypothetical protein [Leptolyngbyaceae cyanobacterium MO_188.B28]
MTYRLGSGEELVCTFDTITNGVNKSLWEQTMRFLANLFQQLLYRHSLIILCWILPIGCSYVLSPGLAFHSIEENQEIHNAEYQFRAHQETDNRNTQLLIEYQNQQLLLHQFPARFQRSYQRLEVAHINRSDRLFIVTKLATGGSGEFYAHRVVRIQNQKIYDEGHFTTCWEPRLQDDYLIFTANQWKCNELFFEEGNEEITQILQLDL